MGWSYWRVRRGEWDGREEMRRTLLQISLLSFMDHELLQLLLVGLRELGEVHVFADHGLAVHCVLLT